jgi:hypothetical protein
VILGNSPQAGLCDKISIRFRPGEITVRFDRAFGDALIGEQADDFLD